jgi:hypothetical protein
MSRVSTERLLRLAALSTAERRLVEELHRLRLASHAQLTALLLGSASEASPASRARMARRTLARLTEQRVLARLERRIGGVRAGSAGYCYYLGPVGQRLVAFWAGQGFTRGRFRPEPGSRYVRHRLAVSELYVQARLADREGRLELLAFDLEPGCWRAFASGLGGQTLLKPDAFARIGLGAYEDRWFIEVDLGTESRPVLARKLRSYVDYFRAGSEQAAHGVFPKVLLLTTTEARCAALVETVQALPAESWALFTVARLKRGLDVISGQLDGDAVRGAGAAEAGS